MTASRDKPPVSILSFSYRGGLPPDADMVFDMRFLKNPFYQQALSARTGQDADVGGYIEADPAWPAFFAALEQMLLAMLPRFERKVTIAFGCTGGVHRSVFTAEACAKRLREGGYAVQVAHRELG